MTQKEQTATGELGIFDMKSNTVHTHRQCHDDQGKNVLRGEADRGSDHRRVARATDAGKTRGRVQGLFLPAVAAGARLGRPRPACPGRGTPAPRSTAAQLTPAPD